MGAASYGINALGQRVTKTLQGNTTVFQYDLEGHLIGVYFRCLFAFSNTSLCEDEVSTETGQVRGCA
ncbi:MAG: hypothetical protein ACREUA_01695 [Burkholderiales bacterium]